MTTWEDLVSGEQLKEVYSTKRNKYEKRRAGKNERFDYEPLGWKVDKQYKNGSVIMVKEKPFYEIFEDEIWSLLYRMGYTTMNSTRKFVISYDEGLTKQIDVFAMDGETCLLIECKATDSKNKEFNWSTELQAIDAIKNKIFGQIRNRYGNNMKCKYIFATKNYIIGDQDINRMKTFQIENFDDNAVMYYQDLVSHIGTAARYQLLSNIFKHTKINNMDNKVHAIKSSMGGISYYSFSIEPERLLKIAYVLHRNDINKEDMPTYQRLIKKERLKAVREYVNNGGYFPNSIIVAIDKNNHNNLKFEESSQKLPGSLTKSGILYLPQTYHSAYIIDGQHRLYGYSGSEYSLSNSIPVIVFTDLTQDDQVKMFMDINENQKAVSKALRNTLIIDLEWNSRKPEKRKEALMLKIAQELGDDKYSPLRNRVITGENSTTVDRCITLEYIKDALKRSQFFNEYKNDKIVKHGFFDKDDNNTTFEFFYPFIKKYFVFISKECEELWFKGKESFLTINNTTYALIKILDDIVTIVAKEKQISVISNLADLFNDCLPYFMALTSVINALPEERRNKIQGYTGGAAKNNSWRDLQVALNTHYSQFTNEDLENYICTVLTDYREETIPIINKNKIKLLEMIKVEFESQEDWEHCLISEESGKNIYKLKSELNFTRKSDDATSWEVLTFSEFEEIVSYSKNWSTYFKDYFLDSNNKEIVSKLELITKIKIMKKIEKKFEMNQKISKQDLEDVKEIESILLNV